MARPVGIDPLVQRVDAEGHAMGQQSQALFV